MKATFNCPHKCLRLWGTAAVCLLLGFAGARVLADSLDDSPLAAYARSRHLAARRQYEADTVNPTNAAQLACTCYDAANFATNRAEHASLAREGIAICRKAIAGHPKYAPAHYYLAMNLGELAQAEAPSLAAYRLVHEVEREFKTAAELDVNLDYAGPARNLGELYFQAPGWPFSIGSKWKAREWLARAAALAPEYPENLLNLAEAQLQWSEPKSFAATIKNLDARWPAARTNFAGAAWERSWLDWNARRAALLPAPKRAP